MKFKKPLFSLGAALFLFFLIFTFLVHTNLFTTLDLLTTENLQKFIPTSFDTPFSLLSLFGSLEIVLLIIFVLWVLNRKLNYFYIFLFFGLFHIFEFIGKFFVNHPSPPSRFFRYDLPFLFPSSGVTTGSSFPSGHMGRTLFILVILVFIIANSKKLSVFQKKLLYCLIVIIVGLMFVSRIYLGEHWLSDTLGGGALGAALGFFSLALL